MSTVPKLFQRQTGNRAAANAISRERLQALEFSCSKVIRSVHTGGVMCLDLDPTERRYLLAGAADASIAVYDTQQPTGQDKAAAQEAGREAAGAEAALTNNAPYLRTSAQVTAARTGAGAAEHTEHAALCSISKQTPGAHRFSVSAVAWYPVDAGLFVSGGFDSEVKVWDANSLAVVSSFSLGARVYAASMSTAATSHCLVAVGSGDTKVMLCDIVSGGFTHTLSGHRAAVFAVHWSPSSEWQLTTGGGDGQLRLWDIRRAGPLHIFDVDDTPEQGAQQAQQAQQEDGGEAPAEQQQQQRRQRPQDAAQQPQDGPGGSGGGRSAAAAGAAGATDAGSERMFLPERVTRYATAHSSSITGVVPTPDGLHWLSAGTDDRVRLWDAATYRHCLVHYPSAFNRANKARHMAVSDDSSTLFFPSGSVVQAYDVGSGRLLRTLGGGHFEAVNACVWNGAAEELYTAADDCNIVVWSPAREAVTAEREAWERGSDGDAWSD